MEVVSLDAQKLIVKEARAKLAGYLRKYNLGGVMPKSSLRAAAFYEDAEAVVALRDWRREYYKLRYTDGSDYKEKSNARSLRWARANKDYKAFYDKEWRASNLEQALQDSRDWHAAHPNYYQEHKAEFHAYAQTYYYANREQLIAQVTAWYRENPDKAADIRHRRRARELDAEGIFSSEDFNLLCLDFEGCCAYCGCPESEVGKLVPDHMTPLSRGGTNYIWNIIPACTHCNSSKSDKTFEEYTLQILKWEVWKKGG